MRRTVRFLVGLLVGGGVLTGYLYTVGARTVLQRASEIHPWALALVVVFVLCEGLVDGLGVWASIAPLGEGASGTESVEFALAGDFFDILSPAGPVSSEIIMARFIGVATETGYSEALGVRSVAKYVKSAAQIGFSGVFGGLVLLGATDTTRLLLTLAVAFAALIICGWLLVVSRSSLSAVLVAVLTPVVQRVSALYRDQPHDRRFVVGAVERFFERVVGFQGSPKLLLLIAASAICEQLFTACAIWIALAGTGQTVPFLSILVIVPLPQVVSAIPIPGSLGAYDVFMSGVIVLVTGIESASATPAVLVVRTISFSFGLITGGFFAAQLPGWRGPFGD